MIRLPWEMGCYVGFAALCLTSACWSTPPLVDGTFTEDEWAMLTTDFRLPEPERCPDGLDAARCDAAARLGRRLFFEPALSGPIEIDDPYAPGAQGEAGKVSCASCHDPDHYFVDVRSQPTNVSSGAIYTSHNAMSALDAAYKSAVAARNCDAPDADPLCANVFAWTGAYATPGGVLNLAGTNAMRSNGTIMRDVIEADATLHLDYFRAFCPAGNCPDVLEPDRVFANVALAFEAYVRRLDSVDSPFDCYIASPLDADLNTITTCRDTSGHEFGDAERRGLAVFLRKGTCIDCHRGPLFSDLEFHDTGVPQLGPHVPATDGGVGAAPQVGMPADRLGQFLTPPLRNVAETAPYMHAGQLATLADVIEFYRHGGVTEGFTGHKDPRIQPLEITDDDARDLEAFLRMLTGSPVPDEIARP